MDIMAAAHRGAAWLDENIPGWFDKVDLDTLNQNHNSRCVLAQSHKGEYYRAIAHFNISDAEQYGFNADMPSQQERLTEAFKAIIRGRRAVNDRLSENQPCLKLSAADVKLLNKRMKQIENPDHSLRSTTLEIQGVKITLGEDY